MRNLFAPLKSHPWLSAFSITIILFLSLLPIVIQQSAIYFLEKETGHKATIENVDINLFNGTLSMDNLKLHNHESSTQIEHFKANIKLSELFHRRIHLSTLELSNTRIPVEIIQKDNQQQVIIAGLSLPKDDSSTDSQGSIAISFGIDQLMIKSLAIQLTQNQQSYEYQVNSLKLKELYSWEKEFARLQLNSAFNQHPIKANLQLHAFAERPKLVGTLSITELPLKEIEHFLPEPIESINGVLTTEVTFTLEQNTNGLALYQYSELSLNNSGLTMPSQTLASESLNWKGDIHYFAGEVQGLKVDGNLSGNGVQLKQPTDKTSKQPVQLSLETAVESQIGLLAQLDDGHIKFQQQGKILLKDLSFQQEEILTGKRLNLQTPKLDYDGKIDWNNQNQTLEAQGKFELDSLKLASRDSAKTPETKVEQTLHAQLALKSSLANQAIELSQTGAIQFLNTEFSQDTTTVKAPKTDWNGTLRFSQSADQQRLGAQGTLQSRNLALKTPEMKLSQSLESSLNLTFDQTDKSLDLNQKGPIKITKLLIEQSGLQHQSEQIDWQGKLSLKQIQNHVDNSPLSFNADGKITASQNNTTLTKTESTATSDQKLQLEHNFLGNLNIKGIKTKEQIQLGYQGDGELKKLNVNNGHQSVQLQNFNWNGHSEFEKSIPTSTEKATTPASITGEMAINASKLTVGSALDSSKSSAIQIGSVTLNSLNLKQLENITLKNLLIDNIKLQGSENGNAVAITNIKQIRLNEARLNASDQMAFDLGNLTLKDSLSHLSITDKNEIRQLNAFLSALEIQKTIDSAKTESSAEPSAATQKSPEIALYSFQTLGKNQIQLQMQDPKHPIKKLLTLEKFNLGSLNNQSKNHKTDFEVKISVDEFSHIESSGQVSPFADKLSLHAKTQINGLSLLDFSPLVEKHSGYQITSGQVSAKMDSKVTNDKLDLENQLTLYKFQLKSADQQKTSEFDQNFQVPLELGLSLLKDKKDNIELKLPIKGDLQDPNFKGADIIATALNGALGKATRAYLLVALQPFGAFALAGEFALDQLSAVRLQPIEFQAGQTELNPEMLRYLTKVSELLKNRSGVQIKLCGGANQQDRNLLIEKQNLAKSKQDSKQNNTSAKQATTSIEQALIKLAKTRQSNIKRALINIGVNTNQIVICKPEISQDSKAPKVEMGI